MANEMPTFQWQPDPALPLADQMHFSKELLAGRIVAGDITTYFESTWPQMWQEAAQTWNKTPEQMREAVRAYGQWLAAVADSHTDEVSTVDSIAGIDNNGHDDTDGM